jgi:hypothetical protein
VEPARFRKEWLNRFGITEWSGRLPAETQVSPVIDRFWLAQRVDYLFNRLPQRLVDRHSETFLKASQTYGWICFASYQAGSAFPHVFPSFLDRLEDALEDRNGGNLFSPDIAAIVELLSVSFEDGTCGLNRFRMTDPDELRLGETAVRSGTYETFLTPSGVEKFSSFQRMVGESQQFRREWSQLKQLFRDPAQRWPDLLVRGMLRRDLIPERNWMPEASFSLDDEKTQFRAVFAVFCWKWFLWAMNGDEPLLMKPSVNVTALGTQIFIPGYMSLDAKRDLDLSAVSRLHKARGVHRENVDKVRVREMADTRGVSRKELLARIAREMPHLQDRQVRRWLADPCADKIVTENDLGSSAETPDNRES